MRLVRLSLALFAFAGSFAPSVGRAQAVANTLEETIPPGANYDIASFRFWVPQGVSHVKAVMVLVPGSNGDGRAQAQDTVWQAYATRNQVALIACFFKDKQHDQNFIEDYVNVPKGSGQALLDALTKFGARTNHPEVGNAPLFLFGMSAGGQFNYEFAAWKPERVGAFVVNKGGIYYTALTPRATRETPALLFIGGKDLESRVTTISGLFQLNRRGGALWALTEEPSAGHAVARSRDLAMIFFEDVMSLRLDGSSLKPMSESTGFIGDIHAKTIRSMSGEKPPANVSMAWFPTERVAKAWQAVVTEKPFDY